jgi:hypothetical protein
VVLVGVMVTPLRVLRPNLWTALGMKALTVATLAHPLTHTANARHHVILFPWLLVTIGALIAGNRRNCPTRWRDVAVESLGDRFAYIAQVAIAAVSVLVVIVALAT